MANGLINLQEAFQEIIHLRLVHRVLFTADQSVRCDNRFIPGVFLFLSLSLSLAPFVLGLQLPKCFCYWGDSCCIGDSDSKSIQYCFEFLTTSLSSRARSSFLIQKKVFFFTNGIRSVNSFLLFLVFFLLKSPHKSCWLEAISQTDWNRVCLLLFVVNFKLPIMHLLALLLSSALPLKLSRDTATTSLVASAASRRVACAT